MRLSARNLGHISPWPKVSGALRSLCNSRGPWQLSDGHSRCPSDSKNPRFFFMSFLLSPCLHFVILPFASPSRCWDEPFYPFSLSGPFWSLRMAFCHVSSCSWSPSAPFPGLLLDRAPKEEGPAGNKDPEPSLFLQPNPALILPESVDGCRIKE